MNLESNQPLAKKNEKLLRNGTNLPTSKKKYIYRLFLSNQRRDLRVVRQRSASSGVCFPPATSSCSADLEITDKVNWDIF